jgi:hypothetical protein
VSKCLNNILVNDLHPKLSNKSTFRRVFDLGFSAFPGLLPLAYARIEFEATYPTKIQNESTNILSVLS